MSESSKTVAELGDILKGYISRSKKTQRQISEEVGMPNPSYLSHMANGRINWVESDYFRPLADALGLKTEEVAELKPDLIISSTLSPDPEPPGRVLPPSLMEAIEEYGDLHPALRKPRVQEQLALVRHWDGGPKTAQDWLDFYLDNRRRFTEG